VWFRGPCSAHWKIHEITRTGPDKTLLRSIDKNSLVATVTLLKPLCSAMEIVGRFTRRLRFHRPEFIFTTFRIIFSRA
jgi:hypothetical protein